MFPVGQFEPGRDPRHEDNTQSVVNDAACTVPEITGTLESDGGMWNIVGSLPENEGEETPQGVFGPRLNEPASQDQKEQESLEMVIDLLGKLNSNHSDFASADSKALQRVHSELQKVSDIVRGFLEFSTAIVKDEGRSTETVCHTVEPLSNSLIRDQSLVLCSVRSRRYLCTAAIVLESVQ